MNHRNLVVAALGAFVLALPTFAQQTHHPVPGEKLDSGLGDLPHYRNWADKYAGDVQSQMHARLNPVVGEKLDSGLGEMTREKPTREAALSAKRADNTR